MRIVAGKHRGRPLTAPSGRDIRPTSDRARESIFNILEHGSASGPLDGAVVLDAFAGTGAFGLEALSRGARRATFIENATVARHALALNIAACDEDDNVSIVNADATDPPPARHPVDLAFLDPPYGAGLATPCLESLQKRGWLGAETMIVLELGAKEDFTPPDFLTEIDRRRYGAAQIVFLTRAPQ